MGFRTKALGVAGAGALLIATPFVAGFEGRNLVSYLDPVGIPTVCEGITRIDGVAVQLGQVLTDKDCDRLLAKELGAAISTVDRLTVTPLNDFQRAALGSFVYNVGAGNFAGSTLLKKLNAGDVIGACNELPKWVYAKGKKLNGLLRRRMAERDMCLKGT